LKETGHAGALPLPLQLAKLPQLQVLQLLEPIFQSAPFFAICGVLYHLLDMVDFGLGLLDGGQEFVVIH